MRVKFAVQKMVYFNDLKVGECFGDFANEPELPNDEVYMKIGDGILIFNDEMELNERVNAVCLATGNLACFQLSQKVTSLPKTRILVK